MRRGNGDARRQDEVTVLMCLFLSVACSVAMAYAALDCLRQSTVRPSFSLGVGGDSLSLSLIAEGKWAACELGQGLGAAAGVGRTN